MTRSLRRLGLLLWWPLDCCVFDCEHHDLVGASFRFGLHPIAEHLSPPELRLLIASVFHGETEDPQVAGAAYVMGRTEESVPWLVDLALEAPLFALDAALFAARLTLRFSPSDGRVLRVLDFAKRQPAAQLPPPQVWLALRRAFDHAPAPTRAEGHRRIPSVRDHRLLAALAYVFPTAPPVLSDGATPENVDDAAFFLFEVLRALPFSPNLKTWPPPAKLLAKATQAQLEAVNALRPDPHLTASAARLGAARVAEQDLEPFFAAPLEPKVLETLSLLTPTEALVARARLLLRDETSAEETVRRSLVDSWQRALTPHPAPSGRLPGFLRVEQLPPLVGRDGRAAAPQELELALRALRAADRVALMAYAAPSLAALVGVLFRQWLAADAPMAHRWAMEALRLAPSPEWTSVLVEVANAWRHQSRWGRAAAAFDTLARIGSAHALRAVADATRSAPPKRRLEAAASLERAARETGLTALELEDRLVEPVSLAAGQSLTWADGALWLLQGEQPVSLPKHLRGLSRLGRDAAKRLERWMVAGVSLSLEHVTETWGMHPLLNALARRVVWLSDDSPRQVGTLEEVLGREATRGLRPIHPVELSASERASWRQRLGAQPIAQLARETHRLEALDGMLRRVPGVAANPSGLLALERDGWRAGLRVDGRARSLERSLSTARVQLRFEPGITRRNPFSQPLQVITAVELEGRVTRIEASELQRSLRAVLAVMGNPT